MLQRLHSEKADLMEKIAEGDWDDSIEARARRRDRRGDRRLRARLRRGGQPDRGGRVRPHQVARRSARRRAARDGADADGEPTRATTRRPGDARAARRAPPPRMATQKDIKGRIGSVKNIRKITRAMEMVAAARLRRAEQRIEQLRPYADAHPADDPARLARPPRTSRACRSSRSARTSRRSGCCS